MGSWLQPSRTPPLSPSPRQGLGPLYLSSEPGPAKQSEARVLLADDQEFVRAGLASLIRRFRPNWEVVGEAADGRQTLELAVSLSPSLIVVELSLPEVDGLTVVEHISRMLPSVSVMILTGQPIGQLVRSTRRMGARAFVSKQERPSDLLLAMDRVVSGAPFFSSAPGAPLPGPDSHAGLPSHYLLTSRELDVVRALARGNTNKQTAESLGMSVRTAESHRASIMHKLGVSSLGELVRIAVRDGIV